LIAGRIASLHRWPVKSMGGEPVAALLLDGRGVAGDRTHAVWEQNHQGWRPLTARQAPRLLAWRAAYPEAADDALRPDVVPAPLLVAPDGREHAWDEDALAALRADLGWERPLRLVRDLTCQQDLERSLLVSLEATSAALEAELGRPLDLRRLRTNVHLRLEAAAFAEEAWEGGEVRADAVRLTLLHPCARCAIPTRDPDTQERWPELLRHLTRVHGGLLGINARADGPGHLEVGMPVEVVPPAR
jgi:uncharacterized protein